MTARWRCACACPGPHLRATGIPYDVRRAHPYSVYPELEFDIPTRTEGDSYARYLLRLDEISESIRIIDQVPARDARRPGHGQLPRLIRVPPGRAFVAIESPRGEYACYAHERRLRPALPPAHPRPVVLQPQAAGELMPGNLIADMMAVMASLDPVMGGVDK